LNFLAAATPRTHTISSLTADIRANECHNAVIRNGRISASWASCRRCASLFGIDVLLCVSQPSKKHRVDTEPLDGGVRGVAQPVWESAEWTALAAHLEADIKPTHLRELLKVSGVCERFPAAAVGVVLRRVAVQFLTE
jgi:hypothetical protein